jgi:hypothetical protein
MKPLTRYSRSFTRELEVRPMLVADHYTWRIRRLPNESDKYELLRDGALLWIRTSAELYRDARFHYDYSKIMRELNDKGECQAEIIKGKLFQMT